MKFNIVFIGLMLLATYSKASVVLDVVTQISKKENTTDPNSVQSKDFKIDLSAPFFMQANDGKISGYHLKTKFSQASLTTLPSLAREVSIYDASIGGTYFSISDSKEFLAGSLSVRISGDNKAESIVLPLGTILTTKYYTDSFNAIYGALYTYSFGEGLLLPILGFTWKTSADSRLLFILPVKISYELTMSKKNKLDIFLEAKGTRSVIKNNNSFSGASENLKYRYHEVNLATRYSVELDPESTMFFEAGFKANRQVNLLNSNQELYNKEIKSDPYIGVGFKVGFGKSNKETLSELIENM